MSAELLVCVGVWIAGQAVSAALFFLSGYNLGKRTKRRERA